MLNTPQLSLAEINNTVPVAGAKSGFLRKLFAFSGPGALVAVGYMDPGNWITSIQGGALYSYLLLSVILLSSLIAMLLQAMCAKLGIVTGQDLAQATRARVGPKLAALLWITTELAIMATEIAEVIGSAVALNLLFGIPLMAGVLLTVLDVFLLLVLMKLGFRKIEAFVFVLILTIFLIFAYEVMLSDPDMSAVLRGFIPSEKIFTATLAGQDSALLIGLGIVGATVMPHNLYLHSSIVQSRQYDRRSEAGLREAIRFATIDSNIQLGFSFIINCLLLVLGAALFFGNDPSDLGRFTQLYDALQNPGIVGGIASATLSTLFAVALLASGQNATITGTLTGQIVMEGFIHLRLPMWLRRVITRSLAVIPVIICIYLWGDREDVVESLLIYTQVFLSIALPFSMIPLLLMTSSKKIMGVFVNSQLTIILGTVSTVALVILNLQLIREVAGMLFRA
ncbi:Nramp family divalent metal transporter [Morganella morganii subsp. morganii]|uniref:Nramp family divalent metal transporter n=1 Tax=Morganella morganii TaxID=582 RepID=UPI0006655827|nr:Nramp family divalent metal transporter [Morganella morganii]ELA8474433.1 Nramp family divalent metal transporter [Morganella morganii]MBA5853780.1 divalent metal cation transporter [Morganella morganii]MBC3976747.1 Nramp family divalent metal transporter [Morganella morganii]MBT0446765.1 Nramp family divalent metal transporter [Morganella morganii subsp. morganii]MBT0450744.1 Nramp family divalent metal transporter [Morganella morganii subsp. morganii]